MKMAEIKDKAKGLSIKPGKMKKAELIQAIQTAEGNIPCFQSTTDYCDQINCLWRSECMPKN